MTNQRARRSKSDARMAFVRREAAVTAKRGAELVGGGAQSLSALAELNPGQAEVADTAVEYRGGRANVAVGIREFAELPEDAGVGRQREGQALQAGHGFGRKLLEFVGGHRPDVRAIIHAEEIVDLLGFLIVAARLHEFKVQFLDRAKILRRERYGLPKGCGRLFQIAGKLPGGGK